MYTKTYSCCIRGINADLIQVEVDVAKGLPGFSIVGLADKSINEAKERISVAMRACDFELAPEKILVNLSPAHIKKEGVHFDLAIAASLMYNFCFLNIASQFLENFTFFGELSLSGTVKKNTNLLVLGLSDQIKSKFIILPKANQEEALVLQQIYKNKKEIFVVNDLQELKILVELLYTQTQKTDSTNTKEFLKVFQAQQIKQNNTKKAVIKLDYADVLGQSMAKRAFEIAASGNHHLLMIGPPGCGKSMLANRYVELLPSLNLQQAIETTKIYNASGYMTKGLIEKAPLRKPHHSLSTAAFIGGGMNKIKPGEVSLAHNGVLFLDEMTEFSKFTLEQLRQILEEKEILISRIKESHNFPANFLLLAACNPCPCGFLGDPDINCRCSQMQIEKYLGKLSGPLLDRIDIHLRLSKLSPENLKLLGQNSKTNYGTQQMLTKIKEAKDFARSLKDENKLSNNCEKFLDKAIYALKLSARSLTKIKKLARTIANLDTSTQIKEEHLSEALQYRAIDWTNYK